MAKITLSEYAPKDQGDLGFTTSDSRTKFTVSPTSGLQTSDKDIVAYATTSVLLSVGEDAPAAPAPRPAAAPDTKDKD